MDLLVSYFNIFGSKTCCFEDLSSYIANLTKEDSLDFCKRLRDTHGEKAETVKQICIQINITRFEHFVGLHSGLSSTETTNIVNKLWKLYEDALPFGESLGSCLSKAVVLFEA